MSKPILTQARLHEWLNYDADNGVFTWTGRKPFTKAGKLAGYKTTNGYWHIMLDYKNYSAHRLAWFYCHGFWPNQIDHKNRNRNDNRLANLRDVTPQQNALNRGLPSNNTSGWIGVCRDARPGKWRAVVKLGHKQKFLGRFNTLEEAIAARQYADRKLGFYNFQEEG